MKAVEIFDTKIGVIPLWDLADERSPLHAGAAIFWTAVAIAAVETSIDGDTVVDPRAFRPFRPATAAVVALCLHDDGATVADILELPPQARMDLFKAAVGTDDA